MSSDPPAVPIWLASREGSQRIRKRVAEVFGWLKSWAGHAKLKVRGQRKAEAVFTFATADCNLIRVPPIRIPPI